MIKAEVVSTACQVAMHCYSLVSERQPAHICVVLPAPAQPMAPADQEADPPNGLRHREEGSPSLPPESPPPGLAALGEAWEAAVREGPQVTWVRAALPSPTGQKGREAHDSCCRWARSFGSG